MTEYPIHPAAELFRLDEEHIPDLANDIAENGLIDPVELYEGAVIDGRRRLLACDRAGVRPVYRTVTPADPVAYVLSKQNRRDLTQAERSMAAARAEKLRERLEAEAVQRKTEGQAAGGKALAAKRRTESRSVEGLPPSTPKPNPTTKLKSRDQLGALMGVSGRAVGCADKVLKDGVPELVEAVDGKKIGIVAASKVATLPAEEQRAAVADLSKPKPERKKDKPAPAAPKPTKGKMKPDDGPTPFDETAPEFEGVTIDRDIKPTKISPHTRGVRTIAPVRGNEAINALKSIPREDPCRARAFQMVATWIENNL